MNLFRLSLANLRYRMLANLFNVLILALGIATIVTLLQVGAQIEQRFSRDLQGIDLVVGAKGSPIQLILSSVFHLDVPNGNIPLDEAAKLSANPLVKTAIPLALGDNYQGYRIVGTDTSYAAHYSATLASGALWTKSLEAVLGSDVAKDSGLKLGESFAGSHGLTPGGDLHEKFPYRVVGILNPTGSVLDRLILTDKQSVWDIHEHPDEDEQEEQAKEIAAGVKPGREITSLLLTYRSPYAAVTLPRLVNKTSSMQAASPAMEIARLFGLLGFGSDAISAFGAALMTIAGIGFFITLWSAVNERRYDIALLRSLGATRDKVFAFVLVEGLFLGVIGALLGIALGHLFAFLIQLWTMQSRHVALNSVGILPWEAYIGLIAVALSGAAAILPAFFAYRTEVSRTLAQG